jgi:deoxyribonuclease-4
MFGAHLSIAGGLENALIEAKDLGMDCVQVFTKNQRQWNAPPLTDDQVRTWLEHRNSTGVDHVVSHDSYLINLASPDRDTREKSVRLFIEEIERCEALAIPWLVAHPGAHKGLGETKGIQRIAAALDRVHKRLPGYRTLTCLEVTAGQGSNLGYRFEHLRDIADRLAEPERIAYCLDTAHALAAGYDLTNAAGAGNMLAEMDEVLGLDHVKVLHVNDSKVPRGSRVDRHAHIGHGCLAKTAIATVCQRFAGAPKILETPKATAPDGRPWDTVNLQTVRKLTRQRRRRR